MNLFFRRSIWISLIIVLALGACGRKEAPQAVTGNSEKPQLVNLQQEQAGNILQVTFELRGNPMGVGYQIDRTEIDPYCKCPGFWRRYTDQQALSDLVNRNIKKNINLKNAKTEYVYRLRAIDLDGNFGPWSKSIRARGIDLFHK